MTIDPAVRTVASTTSSDGRPDHAAPVEKAADGTVVPPHRQSHPRMGQGRVAGALIGLLFPPAVVVSGYALSPGASFPARSSRRIEEAAPTAG